MVAKSSWSAVSDRASTVARQGAHVFEVLQGQRADVAGQRVEGEFVCHVVQLGAGHGGHDRAFTDAREASKWALTLRRPRRMRVLAVPSGMFSVRLISSAVCP